MTKSKPNFSTLADIRADWLARGWDARALDAFRMEGATATAPTLIDTIAELRKAAHAELDELLKAPTAEKRDLLPEEEKRYEELSATILKYFTREEELADIDTRAAAAAEGSKKVRPVHVRSEPLTYERYKPKSSYFQDLVRAIANKDPDADERLRRHAQEMDVEMRSRHERREALAAEEMRAMPEGTVFEKRVNPNRTDGQGGYFVPPLWLVDEYVALARAGRTFANSIRTMPLPEGTDSINIPKIATGATVAIQTADAAAVSSTDITDTFVTAGVKTIAGQQDFALQLLEQSPINFDDIVYQDLLADYNMKLDQQSLVGSGAAGQVQGVNGLAGTNGVTYTDATPTGPELYLPLAQAASLVAGNRYLPITAFFMHPRRWYWLASQLDTNNRPLVTPYPAAAFNPEALQTGLSAEGPVGQTLGAPILIDPNIPTNQGAGTNEDRIYAVRTSDLILWEGSIRTRVLFEVLSGTLQVRVQLYNYIAFMPDRYPKSISVISGTGLIAPAGF